MIHVIDSNGNIKMKVVSLTSTTIGSAIQAIGAGTQTLTGGTLILSNANGVSFGLNGSTLTASAAGGGGGAAVSFSAGTQSTTIGNLVFSNSNSISFGLSNNTVTASVSYPAQTTQPVAVSGSNGSFAFSTVSFGNLNGLSFYSSNGSMVGSYTVPTVTNSSASISAGTQSTTLGNLVFSNSNGLAFGLSNNTITGSYTVPSTAGLISAINLSAGTTSNNLSAFTLSNSNGLAFGLNGSVVTGSYTVPTQSNQNISLYALGNTTQNSSTVLNASNLSFNAIGSLTVGYSNGSIQLSAPNALTSQTNQTANFYVSGNTTQLSSTAGLDLRSISFEGAGVASVGVSNGRVLVSVPSGGGGGAAISAGANSQNTGTVNFANSNGITFGLSNNGTMTASHNGITSQTNQNISLYALGNTTQNSSTVLNASNLSFNAAGSITVGYSNGSIQLSAANALTSQSNQAFSAGAASSTFQTLSFQDSNGVSFSNNAGAIRLTHDLQYTSNTSAITSNALNTSVSRVINLIAATNNTGGGTASLSSNVSFSNANNVTFYTSAGNAIVASFSQSVDTNKAGTGFTSAGNNIGLSGTLNTNGLSLSATVAAQSNQNISLYALGNTTQNSSTILNASAMSFNGLGELSVGFSNGSINLSANVDAISAYAVGNSTQSSSGTLNVGSLSFNGAGNVSVGVSNGSVVISGGTAAASPVNISAGTTSANLQSIVFSNSNNLSFGLNGSTITGSVPATSSLSATGAQSISVNGSTISIGVPAVSMGMSSGGNTGGTSGTVSGQMVFYASGEIGLSQSVNGANATLSIYEIPAYRSYFEHIPVYAGTTAFTMGGSSNFVQPFVLPYDISASYIRIANSMAFGSTTGGTTANTSLTLNNSQSIWVNIYSKGVGANSKSLQYVTGGSVSMVFQVRAEIGAASNNQTVSHNFTYPSAEGAAAGNFATNYNVNSGSYNISTTHLTSFNGFRWLDIPFAASLSAGAYWMGVAQSTATATTGGVAAMTNVTARNTFVAVSQISTNIALMGVSSNMSTAPWGNGLGYWSTNSIGASTSSIGLANISTVANQPRLPFQIIREA